MRLELTRTSTSEHFCVSMKLNLGSWKWS